jgi:hypothetical protein
MRSIWFPATLGVLFLALLVVSATAQGYPPEVVIVEPPQIIIIDHHIEFTLAFVYPNGQPVVLRELKMTIRACGADGKCIKIEVTVNPDGTVSIPITPDFPTGTVELFIVANSMTDSFGKTFPAVDTLIATITVPAGSAPPPQPQDKKLGTSSKPSLFREAQLAAAEEAVQQFTPNYTIPIMLALLAIAGAVLVLLPRRRYV